MNVFSAATSWAIASHNQSKIKEIADLIAPYSIAAKGAHSLNLPEPEETETGFVGNAVLKARAGAAASGLVALADDSGLAVNALDGDPGVYSARWAGEPRDFGKAMGRVHEALKAKGTRDYSARFVCVLALAHPDGEVRTYEGEVCGSLTFPPRGDQGFGYDPIFVPDGHNTTFAQMPAALKRSMSHRANAFALMMDDIFPS